MRRHTSSAAVPLNDDGNGFLSSGDVAEPTGYKIFVGGLPFNVTDPELIEYFSSFGKVVKSKAKKWRNDKTKCKGFAIIVAEDKQTYDKILSQVHYFHGRTIECKRALTNKAELAKHNEKVLAQKIFVTGLPLATTDKDLSSFFSKFGGVEIAYVVKNTSASKKTRIGYVSFTNKADKEAALSAKSYKWPAGGRIFVSDYHTKCELMKGSTIQPKDSKGNAHKSGKESLQSSEDYAVSEETYEEPKYQEIIPAQPRLSEGSKSSLQHIKTPKNSFQSPVKSGLSWKDCLSKVARSPDGLYHPFSIASTAAGKSTGSRKSLGTWSKEALEEDSDDSSLLPFTPLEGTFF